MKGVLCLAIACGALTLGGVSRAGESTPAPYDAALANRLGADARGMRPYVLVILKTGPKHVPAGKARDAMFAGHFANIQRLADAGKLVTAGPFDVGAATGAGCSCSPWSRSTRPWRWWRPTR